MTAGAPVGTRARAAPHLAAAFVAVASMPHGALAEVRVCADPTFTVVA